MLNTNHTVKLQLTWAILHKRFSNLSLNDTSVVVVVCRNTNNAAGFVFYKCAVPTMHFALYTQSKYTPTMQIALKTHNAKCTMLFLTCVPLVSIVAFVVLHLLRR